MNATPAQATLPKHVGKYDVLGIAGRGAMGVVYVGRDPVIDRKVAIKVCKLADDDMASHASRRMFLNEARLAGGLDHPNVLRIHDAGEENGDAYIIMEYVEGARTLQPHTKADDLLPVGTVLEYVRQCAEALDYAHQQGVVHRDIKQANIMLTSNGAVKIVDFGIAQRNDPERTQLLGSFGSPRYMSPEQAAEESVSPASDIYSLGATLFELLTGRSLYETGSLVALLRSIVTDPPPRLHQVRPDLPASLDRLLARALSKNPAERQENAGAMAADLAGVIAELEKPADEPLDEDGQLRALAGLRFLSGLSEQNVREVLRAGAWESHAPATVIITAGEMEHALYLLVSGQVAVRKGDVVIGTLDAGECFGEMSYLERGARSATVTAVDRVRVFKIEAELSRWASLPCQMRFNKSFQRTLVQRLASASDRLSRTID